MSNTRQVALDYAIRLFSCPNNPFPGDVLQMRLGALGFHPQQNDGWNARTYADLFKLANELEAYIKDGIIPEDDDSAEQDNNDDEYDQEIEQAIEDLR